MGVEKYFLLVSACASYLYVANACTMEDVEDWRVTQDLSIRDVDRGTFWNKSTSDITSLTSITAGGGVNYANYLDVVWDPASGRFTISTSDGYLQYEENETSQTISFTVFFQCTGGSNSLIFDIAVQDTNNNPPTFMLQNRPTEQYEFTVTPPLPPGFLITGCGGDDILVRDIDLTTSSIDFTIEDNPYFEIEYAGRSLTNSKEFLASLKTKDLIRSLSEDIELTISATDVDGTQDPRITRTATIRVKADEAFMFPDEPMFTQPFYTATYKDNLVVLDAAISLSQGYDDKVIFSLDGEYSGNFRPVTSGNGISIEVVNAPSNEVFRSGPVVLVVKAEREYTSNATATVIVQLPDVSSLAFEQTYYQGRIVDNQLETLQVTLAQGYENGFNVSLQNEYASYFSTSIQGNAIITLLMSPLEDDIIDRNNFISLQVTASNEYSSATAVVTLDIVKDDKVTPVFENGIYKGEYYQETGLTIEQIVLSQGYDQTVDFGLSGDHAEYFSINNTGAVITLTSSGVPPEVWPEQQLLLTIAALKPRAVTATTTVVVTLPTARQLAFALPTYTGTLQNGNLTLQAIVLSVGYAEDVNFTLNEDYAKYFTLSPTQNGTTVTLSTQLPDDVITENNFLALTLLASGIHTTTASTLILLEIIKQDANTPVFTDNVYAGVYLGPNSIEIGNISLSQGYDSSVTFRLDGEHAEYFKLSSEADNLNLELVSAVPPDVIFSQQVLVFSILAEKPLTVGAHAAVTIAFPRELTETAIMRFAQNTYLGSIENNNLVLDSIVLENGYDNGTTFSLSGEYESYFSIQNTGNVINVTMQKPLPQILENTEFIILEIEANRERAISIPASIVITINEEDIIPLAFSNPYYKSVIANSSLENVTIVLAEGYDERVTFELQGDSSVWFSISNIENNVQLNLNISMENMLEVLQNNDYFLFSIIANKPNAISAKAAIFVHLPKETPKTSLVQFSQASYVGRIENGTLYAPVIVLTGEQEPISFNITGEFAQFFDVSQTAPTNVEIRLKDGSLSANIAGLPFIILDIEAHYPEAISGRTTVILEVVTESEIVMPIFEQPYYTGEYSVLEGLTFNQLIRLSQGFDDNVVFTLAGDDAQWFKLSDPAENNFTLELSKSELGQVTDRSHLVFSVVASKNNSVAGSAAIVINLLDYTTTTSIRFGQNLYRGSIQNNSLTLGSIILEEGYSSDLNISFTGDYAEYIKLINEEGVFTLELLSQIPDSIINDNKVLVFTLQAKNGNSKTHTTILLDIVKAELNRLTFENAYYVGSYSLNDGFVFDPQITLLEGYDETVLFSLEGEDSQWFGITENQHLISLTQTKTIPNEVIANNKHLIFVIVAEKLGNMTTKSTIVITLNNDSETTILRFGQTSYLGSIENNTISLDTIELTEGYSQNVSFYLQGGLENYFTVSKEGSSVQILLSSSIPVSQLPANGIITLELQASAPNAVSAFSTIIFTIVKENTGVEQLMFGYNYYTGYYAEIEGLVFNDNIEVMEANNKTVQFILEGESSQYFGLEITSEKSVTLNLVAPIPSAVAMNNHHLIFTISAVQPGTVAGKATIIIALFDEYTEDTKILSFDRITYSGSLENNTLNLEELVLTHNYSESVSFRLFGDLESYFGVQLNGSAVTISLTSSIPEQSLPENRIIVLEIEASITGFMSANAAIVITVVQKESNTSLEQLMFSEAYYTGQYTDADGLTFTDEIRLTKGFGANVTFVLEGDSSLYFDAVVTSQSVSITLILPIPPSVVMNNHQLIFTIRAEKSDAISAKATVVISLLDDFKNNVTILGFDKNSYLASLERNTLNFDPITLSEGYSDNVTFSLQGDLNNYFIINSEGPIVTISLNSSISVESLLEINIIILELLASAPDSLSAHATLVIKVIQEESPTLKPLIFSRAYYTGSYTESEGFTFTDNITLLEGYDSNVILTLEGDDAQYFETVVLSENSVSLRLISSIPSAVVANKHQFIYTIIANKSDAIPGRATIVIALYDEINKTRPILGFNRISYIGSIENDIVYIDPIFISKGYSSDVNFTLYGELQNYFSLTCNENSITVSLVSPISQEMVPLNRIIVLEIQASAPDTISAHATIVLEVVQEDVPEMAFDKVFYTGQYNMTDGLTFESIISLSQGYDDTVKFSLDGDDAEWFQLSVSGNSVSIALKDAIPEEVLQIKRKLVFVVVAQKPATSTRATIIISLVNDAVASASFGKILFQGTVQSGQVFHETINLTNYNETDVPLEGENAALFSATHSEGTVVIQGRGTVILSPDVSYVALQLQAGAASAVLVLDVTHSDNPDLPSVSFNASSYVLHTDVTHVGPIGLVFASADNNEAVAYSLRTDDPYLLQRLSVSQYGELVLWARINSGVYNFDVIATTVFSKVSASVPVHLTVEALTIIDGNNYNLPPLQILNRNEESPHLNLVPFNASAFEGCRLSLSNRWPAVQNWLYVDDTGLHTAAIDREDESIAFMAQSQIQVELVLQCNGDNDTESTRTKRSADLEFTKNLEHLGPYDYGNSRWILTDPITHNPRRSIVNLIVNDINDNAPVFVGKEEEPIVVGYPVANLEDRILPRALIQVKAIDADVGVNAAIVYWSTAEALAVSPTTGSVHVRDIAGLVNDMTLTIQATDRNGHPQGLTGSLDIIVKLIDTSHIAVVTIQDAFLDDEQYILTNLSAAVGYEVKALRSTLISDTESSEVNSRKKREAQLSTGASMQLYVYGLIEREPVDVQRLTKDISTSVIETLIVASTVSLEDHLEICPLLGRDTALFVSTLVLAVLLFLLIVAAAVWYFFKWRKENYQQFSDENSLASQDVPVSPVSVVKPELNPRINIDDLKRSERRLQEMLETPGPLQNPPPSPLVPSTLERTTESKVSMPEPPLVFQSFDKLKNADDTDDEDEFGEIKKNRRKSVVTFNENVEKIIHVEDTPEDDPDIEVYRL